MKKKSIRIGARGSRLSKWQAEHVASSLKARWTDLEVTIVPITTRGDIETDVPLYQIGGQGVFTKEIERALLEHQIDLAVHCLKDLTVQNMEGLTLAAILPRENVSDCLVSKNNLSLNQLKPGSTVGTSSTRRSAQLLTLRPDLKILPIRGNVDTRLKKVREEEGYDAGVLAYAGLSRLGCLDQVAEIFDVNDWLCAPGQGALAVQCRTDGEEVELASVLDDLPSHATTLAERSFLRALGGGCSLPIAAYADILGGKILLRGSVFARDGSRKIESSLRADMTGNREIDLKLAKSLGERAGKNAIDQGANDLLRLCL